MARDAEAELAGASLHQGLSRLPMSSSLLDWSVRRGVRRNPALGRRASARLGFLRPMGLRICLVSPFACSQPYDGNEHVSGIGRYLRKHVLAVSDLAFSHHAIGVDA